MKNNQIRTVIILGVIAIVGIITVQVFWLRKAYDVKERQFTETIHTALQNVAYKIANNNNTSITNEDIVSQLSSDYFVVNINETIDANSLEFYLRNEFENMQLNLNFEYAIYDCSSDEMVYGNYVNVEEKQNKEITVDLPRYDEFTYYFGVYFPTKANFTLSNLRLSIFFSLILFLAIVFFAYAIYVIMKQKRLSELQTDFINNMTHEFKTPIASISLSSEALLKRETIANDTQLNKYVSIIKDQSARLNTQVEKVLQIADLQESNYDLKKERIELIELANDILRNVSLRFEKREGQINFYTELKEVFIEADRMHFTNIIYNLLDNSLKYNRKEPIVNWDIKQLSKNIIRIQISDNGIGIDDKNLKQIFNKFYRVPTGNVHDVKGFGIGLYYVNQVVKMHNWKIGIESVLDKGTTIFIDIQTAKDERS